MTEQELLATIERLINEIRESKELPPLPLAADAALLEMEGFDSLDLASVLVELESATGRDPFSEGIVEFRTAGELAALYAAR
jgi:acyl carrier protein